MNGGARHIDIMQLVDLEQLQQVLQEFAVEVRNLYQDNLITHDHIASGDLLNSVECRVETEDRAFLVQLTLEKYWKYVEDGLAPAGKYPNPGWKAFPHILNWVTVKPVIPRPDNNGRLPSQKSLAYLITRKIVNEGTKASNDLADARAAVLERYRDRISQALGHDMEWYIRKVIAGEL